MSIFKRKRGFCFQDPLSLFCDSVGVRTQDPQLRRIYEENVINYCSIMCYAVW
nr:MAG TPA: hypothetical protein [Caudoviricetes sp.]